MADTTVQEAIAPYKKFIDALGAAGDALNVITNSEVNPQIKILVSNIVVKLGLNNADAADDITMLRWAVDNEDLTLEKLTAWMVNPGETEDKPTGIPAPKTPEV